MIIIPLLNINFIIDKIIDQNKQILKFSRLVITELDLPLPHLDNQTLLNVF